ncbi:unnamed protein product [Blepharisma stoltei]|uniref:Auxin efflux carrier family protein n=1 Tax=Blepharisma stoltei TaxID=1481888 RepID=A0AAU9JAI7_9CILI|nr:unnamed protein product [Blepharisma stoltei]
MAPLTVITLSGVLLTKLGIFTKRTNDTISRALARFLLPIYLFFNLVQTVNLNKLDVLWPNFVMPVIGVLLSFIPAVIEILLLKHPKNLRYSFICLIGFSNAGLSLLIADGNCNSYGPLSKKKECSEIGGYVAIQLMVWSLIIFTFGYALMNADLMEAEKCKPKEDPKDMKEVEDNDEMEENDPEKNSLEMAKTQSNLVQVKTSSFKRDMIRILTGPIPVFSLLGVLVGFIPGLNAVFYDSDAPLLPVAETGLVIGKAGIVIGQMILGSNLVLSARAKVSLSKPLIYSTILVRNIIIPAIALGTTYIFWVLKAFGDDVVMAFIFAINFAAPPSISVLVLSQIFNNGIQEVTMLILWTYVTGVFTLTIFSYLFFTVFL